MFARKPRSQVHGLALEDDDNAVDCNVANNVNYIEIDDVARVVGVDLGRKSTFTAVDSSEKVSSWSNEQWQHESGTIEINRKLNVWKCALQGFIYLEKHIPTTKSARHQQVTRNFVYIYNNLQTFSDFYFKTRHKRITMNTYIKRKKAMAKKVQSIAGKVKKTTAIAIGNPTFNHASKPYASAPTIGIVKALRRHHRVFLIDEYNTSKLCSKCHSQVESTTSKYNGELKENYRVQICKNLPCIRTPEIGSPARGCYWNRDVNAARNMIIKFNRKRFQQPEHGYART
jgi:hypothetical protein